MQSARPSRLPLCNHGWLKTRGTPWARHRQAFVDERAAGHVAMVRREHHKRVLVQTTSVNVVE
ncbi:hypothetical protein I6F26_26410 [Ensifer sp. IC3342]|nr:hypothetical protein [Ensifer sp. BRP08]MCA1450093.1 hypothetical protein [Ensifer sp. IC3342]